MSSVVAGFGDYRRSCCGTAQRSSFMFVSHVKPDGDTLGAGLALGLALKSLGKARRLFSIRIRFRGTCVSARYGAGRARGAGGFAGGYVVGVRRHERFFAGRGVSAADRAREHAQHRSSSGQFALRPAELHPRDRGLDGNVRAAHPAGDESEAHAGYRDLHPHDDHDGYRRVHAHEHDGRRAARRRPR